MIRPARWMAIGALVSGLAVGIGAFAAHGLPKYLTDRGASAELVENRVEQFETGARYQMYHGLAIILLGLVARSRKCRVLSVAGYCFLAGVLLFSGMLYALVLTGQTWLGAVVPIGGVAFLIGWTAFAISAWKWNDAAAP